MRLKTGTEDHPHPSARDVVAARRRTVQGPAPAVIVKAIRRHEQWGQSGDRYDPRSTR